MKWEPIETAPHDGKSLSLWCAASKSLLLDCVWRNNHWQEYILDEFDTMNYCLLESYDVPTHWLRIEPPQE